MSKIAAVKTALSNSLSSTNVRKTAVLTAATVVSAIVYRNYVQPKLAEHYPLTDEEKTA